MGKFHETCKVPGPENMFRKCPLGPQQVSRFPPPAHSTRVLEWSLLCPVGLSALRLSEHFIFQGGPRWVLALLEAVTPRAAVGTWSFPGRGIIFSYIFKKLTRFLCSLLFPLSCAFPCLPHADSCISVASEKQCELEGRL